MDKTEREKGEKYLKNWGKSISNIEKLQVEINTIRKNNDVLEKIYLENKSDIIDCYNSILNEKLLELKKAIKDYKLIENILNDLEDYKRKVIEYRYIYKNSWQAVALKVHISLRYCFYIKNLVIKKILETIEEE